MGYEEEYKRKLQKEVDDADRADKVRKLIREFEDNEKELDAAFEEEYEAVKKTIKQLEDAEYLPQREFISKAYDEYAERNYQVQLERNEVLKEILKELKYLSSVFEKRRD
jgi:vacuolar-type H+-ATPase subunit I/STV1